VLPAAVQTIVPAAGGGTAAVSKAAVSA